MSKTDTVAPFSLILARKAHFSENSSVRKNFCQHWPKPLLVEDHDAARRAWKGGCTGQRHVRAWCAGMVCSRALSRSALLQPCLRAPASALEVKLRQWRSAQGVLGWEGVFTAQRT